MKNLSPLFALTILIAAASSCVSAKSANGLGPLGAGAGNNSDDMNAGEVVADDGGTAPPCELNNCALQGAMCGIVGDGCGGIFQCGVCPSPETCGGSGQLFHCGGNGSCVPRTCQDIGATCGQQGDGCGNVIQCGTCQSPSTCGGSGQTNVCGGGVPAGIPCTNLCLQQVTCPSGSTTTLSGTVLAGTDPARFGNPDPISNALVYVPNATVQPFGTQVSCDQCGDPASGSPLITALSNIDGTFQLQNVPCGTGINLPVVIQLGRWRRQIVVQDISCCNPNTLTADQTRMPRNKSEGDIPHVALVSGNVDALECVLRKMGIDDSEFTLPSGNGRVHIYKDNGASVAPNTPDQSTLWSDVNTLKNYDMVLFPCRGSQVNQTLAHQQNIIDYTNAGGRLFTTHFSYVWMVTAALTSLGTPGLPLNSPADPQPFAETANWDVNQIAEFNTPITGLIDTSFAKGIALAQWLQTVGASLISGQIPVRIVRRDLDTVIAPSQRWMSSSSSNTTSPSTIADPEIPTLHYTFNTPVGAPADQQCGRAVFSDFHVETVANGGNYIFPGECAANAPLTPQEKLLEFMLFDLASCITPDQPPPQPVCVPLTCAQMGLACGPAGDGCGNLIQCGSCISPQSCGGGGVNGQCGSPNCTPRTCEAAGAECGMIGDGCGNALNCGACVLPDTCGGTGLANICGNKLIK